MLRFSVVPDAFSDELFVFQVVLFYFYNVKIGNRVA